MCGLRLQGIVGSERSGTCRGLGSSDLLGLNQSGSC